MKDNADHTDVPDVPKSHRKTYIVVGVVAAAVSAATVGYFFYRRQRQDAHKMRNVQELLDRSHELVGEIHRRLGDLTPSAPAPSTAPSAA